MKDQFENLNEVFNTKDEEPVELKKVEAVEVEAKNLANKVRDVVADIDKDYNYTRGNLYSIIEKGQEALDGVLELAQESDSARAYEVAGQLIKSVGDATDKLLDLQKKLKDLEEDNTKKGPTNVTNALFVGSTAELSKLLKQNKEEE